MHMLCNKDNLKHFNENDLLTYVSPNDPKLTFDPKTLVEGLKLMHMYESYGHAL